MLKVSSLPELAPNDMLQYPLTIVRVPVAQVVAVVDQVRGRSPLGKVLRHRDGLLRVRVRVLIVRVRDELRGQDQELVFFLLLPLTRQRQDDGRRPEPSISASGLFDLVGG